MIGSTYIYRLLRVLGLKVERYRDPMQELKKLAGSNIKRVIDGGAYRGTVSQEFLEMFPEAEVHAFEPQPDLFANLEKLSAAERRWTVHNKALADYEGEAVFHVPIAAFTASLLTPGESFGETRDISVSTTTLDSWETDHGPVDVLKLDLQGAELAALKGAEHTLKNVRAILCEVNFVSRYENCSLFHEIASFLAQHGFLLHRIYDIRSLPNGALEMADAIFLKSKSA